MLPAETPRRDQLVNLKNWTLRAPTAKTGTWSRNGKLKNAERMAWFYIDMQDDHHHCGGLYHLYNEQWSEYGKGM
jgi:hypothetical protein